MGINRRQYKKIPARMVSITAMFAAFTIVVLYLSYVFPNMKFTFYFLSSVFITGILVEGMTGMAFMMYGVVSILSLILLPIEYALPYIILFGHYGIGKFFFETRVRSRIAASLFKLIYFDIAAAGLYFAVIYTGFLPMTAFFDSLPIWAWALILQLVFFIYDFIYSKVAGIYVRTVRSKIVRSS